MAKNKTRVIWITWENQRRNRELSSALQIPLFEFKEIDQIKNRVVKYSKGITKTIYCLFKNRPGHVICQNPSIVLSLFAVCLGKIGLFKVWVDAHYAGLFPAQGRIYLLMQVSKFIQRNADLIIVTTLKLKRGVEINGGKAFVLQDKIPTLPLAGKKQLRGIFNLVFICTYAGDEPYREVFTAARGLPDGICIYVTGNYKKKGIDPNCESPNLAFTGFLEENDFIMLLGSADALMDLTTREECLVCGAYEGVSLGKSLIVSDTPAIRDYFSKGAVYAKNNAEGIFDAIIMCKKILPELMLQIKVLKPEIETDWERKRVALSTMIDARRKLS